MSDVMLCGILRMPYELWKDDPLQEPQVLSRMREAATELEKRADEIERLTAASADLATENESLRALLHRWLIWNGEGREHDLADESRRALADLLGDWHG